MTSKVDMSLEKGTTPSLPALREGQSSLIAPLHGPQSVTPRQKASQWALETRHRFVGKDKVSLIPNITQLIINYNTLRYKVFKIGFQFYLNMSHIIFIITINMRSQCISS